MTVLNITKAPELNKFIISGSSVEQKKIQDWCKNYCTENVKFGIKNLDFNITVSYINFVHFDLESDSLVFIMTWC